MLALCLFLASAAAAEPPPVQPKVVAQPLLEAALAHLDFKGSAAERERFATVTARLLESPTARELAGVLVSHDAHVGAEFGDFPGTEVYEREPGVEAFTAKEAAHAIRTERSAGVVLNRACATRDGAVIRDLCASQLAHELFGHVLGWVESSAEVRKVYWLYDDELLARFIGWNVTLELTGRVLDPEAYCAAADPAASQRRLVKVYPSSAWGLTRAELRAPAEALAAHRALREDEKSRAAIDGELQWLGEPAQKDARLAAARAAAGDSVFDGLDARLQALRRRLLESDSVFRDEELCGDYR